MRRKGGEMAVSGFREQWRQALPLVGVPRLLRPWLREPGSLTARCLRHCRDFRVRLLRQESAAPLVEMGVEGRRCLPLREVLLECDGRPVVFAHSVLSAPHSGALGRWFAGLGCRSLGSLLFTHPGFQRGPIEYLRLQQTHPLHRRLCHVLDEELPVLWARRSSHALKGGCVLVTEVFLVPGVLALSATQVSPLSAGMPPKPSRSESERAAVSMA